MHILEHVFDIFSVSFFQFQCVSKVSPKNFNSPTRSTLILLMLREKVYLILIGI